MSDDIVQRLRQACEEIERLRAELAQQQCPYIRSSGGGTHWCALVAQPAQSAEPVAWIDDSEHPKHRLYRQSATERRLYGPLRPLYLHPAPDAREAMRLALDVLERLQGGCTDSNDGTVEAITVWCPEVIDALRAALGDDK